jgi:hypothetical protein
MKKSSAAVTIVVAAIIAIAAALRLREAPKPAPAGADSSSPVATSEREAEAAPPVVPAEPEPPKIVVPTGPELKEPDRVRIRADNILATVNGIAVQGRDLLVFGAAAQPQQDLAPEVYDALLARAIERELIVQAAKTKGVKIQPGQQNQLEQVKKTVLAREGGDPNAKYMNVQGTLEEQLAFELREAEALLLRNTLLEQRGHALPYVTAEQVKAEYDAHPETYGALPEDPAEREAAWQKIDYQIRSELSPKLQADYQTQVDAYTQELKGAAEIKTSPST